MGVHPAKSPLNESMHDDMEPQDCALAPVVTKHTALVDEDYEMEHALSASPNISFFVVNARCAPLTRSRKRRLREADQPPSANKAPRLLDSWKRRERGDSDADSDEDICRRSPRSLQFALPGLSSSETLYLLGELVSAHHELTWLNDTHPSNAPVHPVFGWRTALWSLPTPEGHDVAVRKSAKAFEWVSARAIACAMWSWQGSNNLPELEAPRQVYTVNDGIRIVHQHDTLHGRASQSSLWLEYLCEDEDSAYIVRKELHSFQDTIYAAEPKSERECQGYIFRPLFVPLSGGIVSGTALHSISTFQTRGQLVEDTMQFMVDDMPRFVLQWEESFLQSVLPIKV